jgi:transcriptional regulator with XRE-family HTH domain
MLEPGRQLRKLRERLLLKYRDVTEASQTIAASRNSPEFAIGLSRLADIENKGTVPSIYRLYSLAVIYGTDLADVLSLYGVPLAEMGADAAKLPLAQTRVADFEVPRNVEIELPANVEKDPDHRHTSYMSRHLHRWGKLPLVLAKSLDFRKQRYAFIGTEDWSMHPIIRPGSFVQIDESRKNIKDSGWTNEFDRPIYFIEHRSGFRCGWCTAMDGLLILQSHSNSHVSPEIYKYPGDVDILGQIVGVAMRFDLAKRRHIRF